MSSILYGTSDRGPRLIRPDTVFVIGAGVSYDAGYPLIREFLSPNYLKWLHDQSTGLDPFVGLREDRLQFLLHELQHLRATSDNIEEVLSQAYSSPDQYQRVSNYVLEILAAAADAWTCARRSGSTLECLFLAVLLLDLCNTGRGAVLTFNYDLTLETAVHFISLSVLQGAPMKSGFDYRYREIHDVQAGGPIANATGTTLPLRYHRGAVPLLKLHGSVNVLVCRQCLRVFYTPVQLYFDGSNFMVETGNPDCRFCGGRIEPFLVPPGKRKEIPERLSELWNLAEDLMAQKETIVIVGYSVPEYDIEARKLLSFGVRDKEVFYIDPAPRDYTIDFLSQAHPRALTILRQTFPQFARAEMDVLMPDLPQLVKGLCTARFPRKSAMSGVAR